MIIALETGLVTAAAAIGSLIANALRPKDFIGIAIALPLPHLYGISMM